MSFVINKLSKISIRNLSFFVIFLLFFSTSLIRQTSNALLILRMVTKHFVEIGSDRNLYPYFLPQENSTERISLMCIFVDTLYRTAIIIPVESLNYVLHLEVFNNLLSLLSIQMCVDDSTLISAIYSIFMHRLK